MKQTYKYHFFLKYNPLRPREDGRTEEKAFPRGKDNFFFIRVRIYYIAVLLTITFIKR